MLSVDKCEFCSGASDHQGSIKNICNHIPNLACHYVRFFTSFVTNYSFARLSNSVSNGFLLTMTYGANVKVSRVLSVFSSRGTHIGKFVRAPSGKNRSINARHSDMWMNTKFKQS